MDAIEREIAASEQRHSGEIRFVVEAALGPGELLRGVTARERALELFSLLRIWDTELNNGVLIYLLLAEHDVEIIADRGIHREVGLDGWEAICREMETHFRRGAFEHAVVTGIEGVTAHLVLHFPAQAGDVNQLPDRPVVM